MQCFSLDFCAIILWNNQYLFRIVIAHTIVGMSSILPSSFSSSSSSVFNDEITHSICSLSVRLLVVISWLSMVTKVFQFVTKVFQFVTFVHTENIIANCANGILSNPSTEFSSGVIVFEGLQMRRTFFSFVRSDNNDF